MAAAAAVVAIGSAGAVPAASNRPSAAATVAVAFDVTLLIIGVSCAAVTNSTAWCQLVASVSLAECTAAATFNILSGSLHLARYHRPVSMNNHAAVPAWRSYATAVQAGIARQQAASLAAAGAVASCRAAGSCSDGRKGPVTCIVCCCLSFPCHRTCCIAPAMAMYVVQAKPWQLISPVLQADR